jgi:6-phosphogluconate dehydrogenase
MTATADIGLIGLAVMGQNLVLNMDDHGYTVAVFNRTTARVDDFLAGPALGTRIIGTHSLEDLVASLTRPRKVMLMVKAGDAVDGMIDQLLPMLDAGDIIIDGGNSQFSDTVRRTARVEAAGALYVGTGVSGGEEGARHGPSIMPGGSAAAWPHIRPILQDIAAKVADGTPCCDWVGPDGAGHFVKMVHNGIEYGDMQVIAEAYHFMKDGLKLSPDELSEAFRRWGEGVLDSYLIDITADILAYREEPNAPHLDSILDAAGQKGTGKWTAISALDLGMPTTLVAEAVFARIVSALKDERIAASGLLTGPRGDVLDGLAPNTPAGTRREIAAHKKSIWVEKLEQAVYAAKIISYAQGFMLLRAAAVEYGWDLDYGRIASLWREGCIIRAAFLDDITAAYATDPHLTNLMLDPFFRNALAESEKGLRATVRQAVKIGIPVPAYSTALAFYDSYRSGRLPANLIQAQRDYFGAHTYERIDRPRGEFFHTNWTGTGGDTTAGTYEV